MKGGEHTMTKLSAKLVKETKTHRTLSVPAYSDGVLVGWGQVEVFQTTPAGLEAARKALTKGNVVDLNRQTITDVKNAIRTGRSLWAALKKESAKNPELAKEVEVLAKKYGFNVK